MRVAGIDLQGKDVIGENYNFDLIPLGVSGLRYKRTWTLYIWFVIWCITVTGENNEIGDFLARIKSWINWPWAWVQKELL